MRKKIISKINYWLAPWIWNKKTAGQVKEILYVKEKPFYNNIPSLKDKIINDSFIESNTKWDHEEYIRECTGQFYIDPFSGILIDEKNQLISKSIVNDHLALYPPWFVFSKAKKNNLTKIPEAILFDYHKSRNYFHFHSDTLGKLLMIQEHLPHKKNIPLIISEEIYKKSYVQFFLQQKEIASFNWYVQKPDEVIETQKAYLLQQMPYDVKYWNWIKNTVAAYLQPLDKNKKLFIDRPVKSGRYIQNYEEIHRLVKEYGYEIIALEGKTVEEQIKMFSSAAQIVSIHGAGMTNILYCDKNARILEIMPDERISSHYYWLAGQLGLQYECILGDRLLHNRLLYPKGRFYLSPHQLRTYLDEIEQNPSS